MFGIHSGAHHRVSVGAPQTSPLRPSQIRMTSELAIEHNKASLCRLGYESWGVRSYAPFGTAIS